MLVFQKIVIVRPISPMAVAEQYIFAFCIQGENGNVLKCVVKSFLIAHKITSSFSGNGAGAADGGISMAGKNKDTKSNRSYCGKSGWQSKIAGNSYGWDIAQTIFVRVSKGKALAYNQGNESIPLSSRKRFRCNLRRYPRALRGKHFSFPYSGIGWKHLNKAARVLKKFPHQR